jgi:hypothetical protein
MCADTHRCRTPTKDEKKGKQKKQKQQSPQKPKEDEEKKEEAKKAQPPQKKQAGKEVVLQNGLKYVDLEVGEGDAVKRGDKVSLSLSLSFCHNSHRKVCSVVRIEPCTDTQSEGDRTVRRLPRDDQA